MGGSCGLQSMSAWAKKENSSQAAGMRAWQLLSCQHGLEAGPSLQEAGD